MKDAERLADEHRENADSLLIAFEHASPPARDLLRKRRISYASTSGELFLCTPKLLVDRAAVRRPTAVTGIGRGRRGIPPLPFARRSARIARWLLLHRGAEPTIGDLVAATGLSRPFTSQIAAAPADEGLLA